VLTEDEVVDALYAIILRDVKHFLTHNTTPIKTFLSGGVDSMLVHSFVKKITSNYQLVDGEHFEFDKFWCSNSSQITNQYWAYKQMHHWRTPTVLTSGAPGDEYLLRSPTTANLFLMHYGTDILQHCDTPSLHQKYFLKEAHVQLYQSQANDTALCELVQDREQLFAQLCNINLNDWQHWHLGNTITFTPLRNIELFKLMLRLPAASAIGQIFNSTISKRLIAMNDASLLQYLSTDKNHNAYNNLWPYLASNMRATSGQ
jgi:hypothetical protein